MDLTFDLRDRTRFNVRVAVLMTSDDRVLLQGDGRHAFFVLPGGRCQVGESSRQAASRELDEELGPVATVDRLLWTVEKFFELDGRTYHEHAFYYYATLPAGHALTQKTGRFQGLERGVQFFEWVAFDRLGARKLYPAFLAGRIDSLPQTVEHAVIDDRA